MKIGAFEGQPLLVPVGLPPFSFRCPGVYLKNAALAAFNADASSFLTSANSDGLNTPNPLFCGGTPGSGPNCYHGMTPFVLKFDISCQYEPSGLNNAGEACVDSTTLSDASTYTYFGCQGDMTDIAVSPTDPLFIPFHANLDRMNLQWLQNLGWGQQSGGSKSFESLGFPSVGFSEWLSSFSTTDNPDIDPAGAWNLAAMDNGTLLDHTVNGNYAFKKGILDPLSRRTDGLVVDGYYTHRDVLYTTYQGLDYTYAESSVYTSVSEFTTGEKAGIAIGAVLGVLLVATISTLIANKMNK
jgi:hypothetical protein